MTDQLETEYREKLIKDSVLILAQEVHTVKEMTKELRTHAINIKWSPIMHAAELLLLCLIFLVELLKR